MPGASISITPTSGPGGTGSTLTGEGFKAFTTLTEVLEVGGEPGPPRPFQSRTVGRDGVLQSSRC